MRRVETMVNQNKIKEAIRAFQLEISHVSMTLEVGILFLYKFVLLTVYVEASGSDDYVEDEFAVARDVLTIDEAGSSETSHPPMSSETRQLIDSPLILGPNTIIPRAIPMDRNYGLYRVGAHD